MARQFKYWLIVLLGGVPLLSATPGAISGYVRNSAGAPQTGAIVEVFTSAAALGKTVLTDARGFYAAENLAPGVYQVKVSAPAFLISLREGVNLRSGAHVLVNLTLTTLTDALKLIPKRRGPDADPDDWHWTLRSATNRPVLRVLDKGPLVVVTGPENSEDHTLKARVAFIAGAQADGFGSASEMTTAFELEKSLFGSDTVTLNGNIGTAPGDPTGVLRASYSRDFGDASRPKVTLTYRRLATPGMSVPAAEYSAMAMTTSDSMSIAGFIDLDYGADLEAVEFARRIAAVRPFGTVDIHVSPNMVVEYRYATSGPDPRAEKGFDSAPADLSESGPRMSLAGGLPQIERAQHHEISLSRRLGATSIQVGAYSDRITNMVLTGTGDPSDYADNVLADLYSGTFSFGGGNLSTNGARFVVQRKINDHLAATVDYSTGGVACLKAPVSTWQSVASSVAPVRQHSVAAKFSGYIPASGARWIASYKWTSGNALSQVDEFNASPGHADPYMSFFFRQPLPARSFTPVKLEALVDVRNLLAQGYVPVLGKDGRTIYLVQAARAVRGGLSFTF